MCAIVNERTCLSRSCTACECMRA